VSFLKEEINKLKCVSVSEEKSLSRRTVRQLIPFASTYLCGNGFSNYAATKTKYINRLNVAPGLRIQYFNIKTNIKIIS
jgi:hypothetical protein